MTALRRAGLALEAVDYRLTEGNAVRALLANCSLGFPPGKFICLTGPSGCGKTTILSLLAGVCTPHAGRVLADGIDIAALDTAARRRWRQRNVGMVFQTCRLIDVLTVAEHMDLVAQLREAPEAAAHGRQIARSLGLGAKLDARPGQLSGGEKQRAALAQALANRPAVLLADEPTAALDRENGAEVAAQLGAYARAENAVVVAVSHDRVMMDAADKCVDLKN
ncbi:MAG: ABC transporter ATP-binding protein [Polymorphobacter sp.]